MKFKNPFSRDKNEDGFVEEKEISKSQNQQSQQGVFFGQTVQSPTFGEKAASTFDKLKKGLSSSDRVLIMAQTVVVIFILYFLMTRCWISVFIDSALNLGLSSHCVNTAKSSRASATDPQILDKLSLTEGPLTVKGKVYIDKKGVMSTDLINIGSLVNVGEGFFYVDQSKGLVSVGSKENNARLSLTGRLIMPSLAGEGTRMVVVDKDGNILTQEITKDENGNPVTISNPPQNLSLEGDVLSISDGNSVTLPSTVSGGSSITDVVVTGGVNKILTVKQSSGPDITTTFTDLMSSSSGDNSGSTGSYTGVNGISISGSNIALGGALDGDTAIDLKDKDLSFLMDEGNLGIGVTNPSYELTLNGSFGILESGDSPSKHTVFRTADQTADIIYTLPRSLPSTGGYLKVDEAGNMSWSVSSAYSADGKALKLSDSVFSVDLEGSSLKQSAAGLALNLTNANSWSGAQSFTGGADFPGSGVWNSSGNVGIGNSSPQQKLDVSGAIKIGNTTSTTDGTIRWTGTDFEGYQGGTWVSLTSASGGGSGDWTVSGDDMYTDIAGNVGIGVTSPASRLTLDGDIRIEKSLTEYMSMGLNSSGDFHIDSTNDVEVNLASGRAFRVKDALVGNDLLYVDQDGKIGIGTNSPDAELDLNGGNFALNGGWISNGGFDEGIFISSSGDVGINNSSPNESLTVDGSLSLQVGGVPTATSGYGKAYVKSDDGRLYYMDPTGLEYPLSGALTGVGNHGKIAVWNSTFDISYESTLHYDTTWDYLGIGTDTPSYPLDVDGEARFNNNIILEGGLETATGQTLNLQGNLTNFPINTSHFDVSGNVLNLDTSVTSGSGFDSRFVNEAGDTMTGDLTVNADLTGDAIYQGSNRVIDTVTAGTGVNVSGTGSSRSVALSSTYQSGSAYDGRFVNVGGDTMIGSLVLPSNGLTVGTNQLIVSGGNVGIGINPTSKLHVSGNSNITGNLIVGADTDIDGDLQVDGSYRDSSDDPGTSGYILSSTATGTDWIAPSVLSGDGYIGDTTTHTAGGGLNMVNNTLSGNSFSIPASGDTYFNSGDFGIGLINPSDTLDVDGSATFRVAGTGGDVQIATPDSESGIILSDTNRADVRFDNSTLKLLVGAGTSAPSDTNGLIVNTYGEVGIGVDPTVKLDVSGATLLRGNLSVEGYLQIDGSLRDSSDDPGTSGYILSSTATGTDWVDPSTLGSDGYIGDTATHTAGGGLNMVNNTLSGNSFSIPAAGETYFNSGNVGIGTVTPQEKLDLRGDLFIPGGDEVVDCDGSATTAVGSCNSISEGDALIMTSNDIMDYNFDGLPDGQPLCTDDISSPTIIAVDDNNDCLDGAGGIVILGAVDGSETQTVNSEWGFQDLDGDSLLDDGEDLYIDVAPKTVYSSSGGSFLIVDPINNKLGLNTKVPTEMLDINGNARFRTVGSDTYANDLNLTADGTLTTSSSDMSMKTNLQALSGVLPKINQLQGYSFNWKKDPNGKKDIGLIAQEVEPIFPEVVFTNNVDGKKGINYSRFAAILIEGIKEQYKKVVTIDKELTKLLEGIKVTEDSLALTSKMISISSNKDKLVLQPEAENNIEFMDGKVVFDKKGNIEIKEGVILGNSKIRGIDVPVGEDKKELKIKFDSPRPSDKYAVSITPSWMTILAVEEKTADHFIIKFSEKAPKDGKIDWIIID